jgi:Coenzyme PQQ synthesis protein D (PqqD)
LAPKRDRHSRVGNAKDRTFWAPTQRGLLRQIRQWHLQSSWGFPSSGHFRYLLAGSNDRSESSAFIVKQLDVTTLCVTIDSILVRDREPRTADLTGGVVVLSMSVGSYFSFNQLGSEIWTMLGEPCRVGHIFNVLSQRHGVDAQTLTRDVMPFLQKLIEHRLIRVRDPGDGR